MCGCVRYIRSARCRDATSGPYTNFFLSFQWTVFPTSGNRPFNNYHYRLYVSTGLAREAGTTSTVYLQLTGDLGESGVRRLQSEQHRVRGWAGLGWAGLGWAGLGWAGTTSIASLHRCS